MLDVRLQFEGEVIEEQRLLNGARYLSVEGRSEEGEAEAHGGAWTLTLNLEQPKDAENPIEEGDLTLVAPDRTLFAGLESGRAAIVIDEAGDERELFELSFRVSAGEGALHGSRGLIELRAELTGDRLIILATLHLTAPKGGPEL
jgi:hypothetical protein